VPLLMLLGLSDESLAEKVSMKRVPGLPRAGYTLSATDNTPQTLVPVPYETTI
jgi:large subunit ribosomal protein L21e